MKHLWYASDKIRFQIGPYIYKKKHHQKLDRLRPGESTTGYKELCDLKKRSTMQRGWSFNDVIQQQKMALIVTIRRVWCSVFCLLNLGIETLQISYRNNNHHYDIHYLISFYVPCLSPKKWNLELLPNKLTIARY